MRSGASGAGGIALVIAMIASACSTSVAVFIDGSGAADRPSQLLDVPTGGTWRMTIQSDGTTEECPSTGFKPGGPP